MRREWVDEVMKTHGYQRARGVSYIEEALLVLELGEEFTAKTLIDRAEIPKVYIYRVLKRYPFFKKIPYVFPEDYAEYTRKMRRRYRRDHGLPARGALPVKYRFTIDPEPLPQEEMTLEAAQ